MASILNIDTATDVASVCLSKDNRIVALRENFQQKEHASFINVGIDSIFTEANMALAQIDAVAVTAGPGSYTGLRVGLSTAKGLCYALKKPLITLNTLKVMAVAAIEYVRQQKIETPALYCPMIDARRMEVFTALFNENLDEVAPSSSLVLENDTFHRQLEFNKILFFGNGSQKFSTVNQSSNASFVQVQHNASHLVSLAEQAITENNYTELAYSEPNYLKEFFTPANK